MIRMNIAKVKYRYSSKFNEEISQKVKILNFTHNQCWLNSEMKNLLLHRSLLIVDPITKVIRVTENIFVGSHFTFISLLKFVKRTLPLL